VDRWQRQLAATHGGDSPAAASLATALADAVPASGGATIVHGDFRIDNTVLDPAVPGRISAVLDWEMSTLGDPLADLGLLLVYWSSDGDGPVRRAAARGSQVTRLPGFPRRDEVAGMYASASGRDLGELPWYVAFGFFKLAVVVAGVVARHRAGAMVGAGFEGIEEAFDPLVELGRETLRTGSAG
jgi:aminoglycoside phosphotransferase (APT) family kinase protein